MLDNNHKYKYNVRGTDIMINITDQIRKDIRNLRKTKGIRGDDLSKLVGKSPSYISRIENGKTATIEDLTLYAIYKNLLGQSDEAVQEYIERNRNMNMENMSVYSVVVYYTGGSSRGYLISAEDRNKLMEKLAEMLDYNNVLTVHVGEIFEAEDMMK